MHFCGLLIFIVKQKSYVRFTFMSVDFKYMHAFHSNIHIASFDSLCLGYICYGHRKIYMSTIFPTIFRHRRELKATTYVFTLLTITLRFLRRQTRTKPYRDLADIVRQPQGYRTIIVLSSRPPYINRTMPVRRPCRSCKESVR